MRLQHKVAVITGAGSGIGKATALLFAREGARVVAGDHRPEQHAALLEAAETLPGRLVAVTMDVTREDDARRLILTAVEQFGGLDILVNNAGIVAEATVAEETGEQWRHILDVNLTGAFLCSKYAVREMLRRGRGAIVNVSSINGIRGNNRLAAYCASKGGLVSLTHAMAIDHAAHNIRVNSVCPGTVEETGMVNASLARAADPEAVRCALVAKHPMGRAATPAEVAHAILFLASDEASFITGVTLPVDGGRSIR